MKLISKLCTAYFKPPTILSMFSIDDIKICIIEQDAKDEDDILVYNPQTLVDEIRRLQSIVSNKASGILNQLDASIDLGRHLKYRDMLASDFLNEAQTYEDNADAIDNLRQKSLSMLQSYEHDAKYRALPIPEHVKAFKKILDAANDTQALKQSLQVPRPPLG